MNLVIVKPEDFVDQQHVVLFDRRFQHILKVHRAVQDQCLKVGLLNGQIGLGTITHIDQQSVSLALDISLATARKPPAPLPLTLILALPRPKMLRRILQSISCLGVKELYLIHSYKVDKSYWSTPVLSPASIEEQLLLGLEQAGDTVLPKLHLRKRFKPFVEDELANIAKDSQKLVAHPYQAKQTPTISDRQTTLVIGPEGGFIDYEVQLMQQHGFSSISLGERILKVETAIPVALAKLFH